MFRMAKRHPIKGLYYITHVDNIPSILKRGILFHKLVEEQQVQFTAIYDTQIVTHRRDRLTPDGKSLWEFANLYFQPRNAMLYRVIIEKDKNSIAIVAVSPQVLNFPGVWVAVGNAASPLSDILPVKEGLEVVSQMWDVINSDWWRKEDGSLRKMMAECLVPNVIPPEFIDSIYIASHSAAAKISLPAPSKVPIPEPHLFFQPAHVSRITDTLSLVDGDMFFSQMQTLTISVNTVGVMGKGLASRTKYQFPDVYVFYQDLCRKKTLQMGKPYLYKRESSVDELLADDTYPLPNANANKWFLLFPTKRHWRNNSDIKGIEDGLAWISNNYAQEKIKSLAMPALGCGLGKLEWSDIGPLMCKYLAHLDIPVSIYLPREQNIPDEQRTPQFLLKESE
jgi:hypothetical protein